MRIVNSGTTQAKNVQGTTCKVYSKTKIQHFLNLIKVRIWRTYRWSRYDRTS